MMWPETVMARRTIVALVLWLLPVAASAQWLEFRTPGIPRKTDGKADLMAPASKMPDGKPDLSGLWRPDPNPYRLNLIQTLKDESVFKPAAEAIFKKNVDNFRRDDPVTHCLPGGPSEMLLGMYRIMQSPSMIGLLYEGGSGRYRQIFLDGRTLPVDPNPTWFGYSVGRWEGDTLVVDSAGFNDRTWLDRAGHPHSERLHVTERFRRVDFGHIRLQMTFDDPDMLVAPISLSLTLTYAPDTEMLETVCNEGERDTTHLVREVPARINLGSDVLKKYTGTYTFREGPGIIAGFMGSTQVVSLVDGQLFLNALPLIAQSETMFDSSGSAAEFRADARGVIHLVLKLAEGEAFYDLKR
jgi:hypothetical protein